MTGVEKDNTAERNRRVAEKREQLRRGDLQYDIENGPKLIEDLFRLQVELETQNEELRNVQLELEAQVERYSELYNSAPIGLLTLDEVHIR